MIRINLLETPKRKRRRRSLPSGGPIILLCALLTVGEGLLLLYWMNAKEAVLTEQTRLAQEEKARAQKLQGLKAEVETLQASIKDSQEQTELFDQLDPTSVGPGYALLYLTYILTKAPTGSQELAVQNDMGWDTEWDPDRAWFTSVEEQKGGYVLIQGNSLDFSDADQVYKRLADSPYFLTPKYLSAERKKGNKGTVGLVEFKIEASINYNPDAGKEGQRVVTAASVGGVAPKGKRNGR